MSLIYCKNLSVSYGEVLALDRISFEIEEKDYLCIVGENGSGKSTLLKSILGLKKRSCGEIFFKNLKRDEIGYFPQKTIIQKDFPATVEEVVLSGCVNSLKLRFFYGNKEKNKVKYVLNLFKLEKLKNISFKDLSKGQQQKVLLARAFCAAKKVLFLDEPCSSLDPVFAKEFYDLIENLNKKNDVAIVMVSHDVRTAISNAKKILHIGRGVLFFGEAKEYKKRKIAESFLKGE